MKDRLNKVVTDIDLYSLEVYKPGFLKSDDVNSRYRYFRLHYNEEPIDVSGLTAKAYMLKSDGKEVWNHLTIEEGLVVLEFTQQALASPGQLSVEIVLSDSNMTFELSSFILQFEVIRSLRTDASIESTNEFGVLQAFLRDLSGANEKYNTWNAKLEALYNDYTASHEAFKQTEETIVASENERIASENIRKSDESTRVANEAQRIKDENIRKASEQTRTESENTRQVNETTRQNQEQTRQTQEQTRANEFAQMKRDFNALAPEQSTNAEVQLARTDAKGTKHDSLKARLDSDAKMKDAIDETKEGSYLTFTDTVPAPITNIIVKGQTLQNPNNLAEIYSTGIDNGDGTFTYEFVSCGENLNAYTEDGDLSSGDEIASQVTVRSAYIRVTPGMQVGVMFQLNDGSISNQQVWVYKFDSSKKFISNELTSSKLLDITHDGYIRVKRTKADIKNIIVNSGIVPTKYVPYEETRCTIKLPCQLNKAGNYNDLLYFSEADNAWVVDKLFTKYTLADLKAFYTYSGQDTETVACFCSDVVPNLVKFGAVVSNRFKSGPYWNVDAEVIAIDNYNGGNRFFIKVNKSALTEVTPTGLYDYLDKLSFYAIARSNDEKIVLPQSEQIKLNSFANKTHVYSMTGYASTSQVITVSKSHSSATNANTKEIDKLNDKLQRVIDNKDDVEYTYKSDNGVVVARDTNRGNISKAVINGKALVNISPIRTTVATGNGTSYAGQAFSLPYALDNDKEYTLMCKVSSRSTASTGIIGLYDKNGSAKCIWVQQGLTDIKGMYIIRTLKPDSKYEVANNLKILVPPTNPSGATLEVEDLMIFEGRYDGILDYVDGMQSVKNDTGLKLMSANMPFKYTVEYVESQKRKNFKLHEDIQPGTVITNISDKPVIYLLFDKATNAWQSDKTSAPGEVYVVPSDKVIQTVTIYPHNGWAISNNIILEELIDIDSEPLRDTHDIFYKDETGEYVPLTELHEFDTLDLTNNVFTKGTLTFKPDTSTGWRDNQNPNPEFKTFWYNFAGAKLHNAICDKLPVYTKTTFDKKCMFVINNEYLYITLPKTECADTTQLNTWFKNNNIEILLPIEQAKYETNRLSLDTFDRATSFRTNAQNVQPDYEVTITSSINSLIGNIDDTLDSAVDDIQDIKHDLAKLTSSKEYEFSGVGSKVMTETEQGTLSELKIYGKSLVNNIPKLSSPVSLNTSKRMQELTLLSPIMANTEFTIGINITAKKAPLKGLRVGFRFADGSIAYQDLANGVYLQFKQFTLAKDVVSIMPYLHEDEFTADDTANLTFDSIVVCEGVSNTIFNGIACVGNYKGIGDANPNVDINVRSVDGNGNLFDDSVLTQYIKNESDAEYELDYGQIWYNRTKLVDLPFKENTSYKFICTQKCSNATSKPRFYFRYTDGTEDHVTIANVEWDTVTAISRANKTLDYISATYGVNGGTWTLKKNSICLYEDTTKTEYTPCIQDITPILYKDTDNTWKRVTELHGIDANNRDIIDTVTNKYVKNYFSECLDGSQAIIKGTTVDDTTGFTIKLSHKTLDNSRDILCDRFPVSTNCYAQGFEGIFGAGLNVFLRIKTAKASTPEQLKQYLQTNNINVVCRLATPLEYEINPILTQVFDDSTMLQITGGPISAEFKAKCIASYSRRIDSIETRLDRVEENVFKVIDNIQATVAQAEMANYAYAQNVASVQDAQDRMLMESDMRLMQVEMMLSAEPASTKTITYTSVDAKGGAVVMTSTYYEFISHMIERGTHDKAFIARYIDMCEQTGRLTKEEAEQLKTELNPPAIEQA